MDLCKRVWDWFCTRFHDNINWCEGYYKDGTAKPVNHVYLWFYNHNLFPFKQTGCLCCNSVRCLVYGSIIGAVLGPKYLLYAYAAICTVSCFLLFRSRK